jgi:alkylation response protein AidB-like acyl-CoA dehydrogenase
MNFEPDEVELALQQGIRDLCGGRAGAERLRAAATSIDRDLWRELGEGGVFSVLVTEEHGGLGLGFAAASLVLEELGRALVPGPLAATMLAAAAGDAEAAAGRRLVGAVEQASPARIEHARDLDVLVVLGAEGARRLDPAALEMEDATPLDPLTGVGVVRRLPEGEPFRAADGWGRAGAALTSALLVGLAAGATEHAVAYAKDRRQFDREIGSFQAVKHLLADMLVRTEVARSAAYAAAATLDDPSVGDPDAAVSAAKVLAGGAAFANGRACVQVMGGMGFTWEMPAHLYLKRAVVLGSSFGQAAEHEDRLAGAIGR